MADPITLPPLPEPDIVVDNTGRAWSASMNREVDGIRYYAASHLHAHAAAVSAAKDAEIERLRAEVAGLRAELLKSLADNAALRERVKLLEDALRHVDDCLSINDYDDYVLLSRFDSDIVSAALEQKP